MPVRVYSELDEFRHCFVEVVDNWTVRELNGLFEARDQWLELFRRKVTSLLMVTAEGDEVTTVDDLIVRWDDLDVRLARFVNTSLSAAVDHLATLGGMQRRVSSGAGESPTTTRTPTTRTS